MALPIILTVDDDPQVLAAIARDLRRQYGKDYRIMRAPSGAEALEALEAVKERGGTVSLLLSDQRMPSMNGVEFLTKAQEHFPKAKRALLTAYSDTEAAIGAINASHVDYYFVKPWDPPEDKLYPIIDGLLDDWQIVFRPGFDGLKLIADRWSARSHQLRDFLARNLVPYTFLDVELSEEARELKGNDDLPLLILENGTRIINPSEKKLAGQVGLQVEADNTFYDLAIIRGGPAGLATAVYGGSEGLSTVLIEESAPGGQAGTSSRIENYLGFPAGLSGSELASRAVAQARKFGVEMLTPRQVASIELEGPYRHLIMDDGTRISCHALMLSMGVSWRMLPAEGAERYTDQGLYYGAALTEVDHCANETVFMVGAGNSAGQAAMRFAEKAAKVVMLVRGKSLEAKMSQYLVDRIYKTENIEVRLQHEVIACKGDARLDTLTLRNRSTGAEEDIPATWLFVFIGAVPRTDWISNLIALDDRGFVLTGPDLKGEHLKEWPLERDPWMLETNVPGIFAAGDVRHESVKRVASAVGEGSVSVHFVHRHLASL